MLWSRAPEQPPRVKTDTVIPFHFKDDSLMKNVIIDFTYRFDAVLDPEKLRSALERLIEEHGQWRKVGARVRQNKEGKLEFHVPATFDRTTRPSVDYTHSEFSMSVNEHPAAPHLPVPGDRPASFSTSPLVIDLIAPGGEPNGIAHWLYSDRPLLLLHVMSFTDATLVSLKYSHGVQDGLGLKGVFTGWAAVLNDREDQIPQFTGYDEDLILPLTSRTPGDQYLLAKWCTGGMVFARFVLNFLREMLTYSSEARYIVLPGYMVEDMKKRAIAEAREASSLPSEKVWLSEGDVLMSWWSKLVISALKTDKETPVALTNAMDIRDFALGKIPRGAMYLGNALDTGVTFLSAGELLEQPVGVTALRVRNDLAQLRTQTQIEAKMNLDQAAGGTAFLGPADQVQLLISNWVKLQFFDIDFSGAVVSSGSRPSGSHGGNPGRPNGVYFNSVSRLNLRNAGPIVGRDPSGNWWMMMRLRTKAWPAIDDALKTMGNFGWHPGAPFKSKL